jgi:hypothetical protein
VWFERGTGEQRDRRRAAHAANFVTRNRQVQPKNEPSHSNAGTRFACLPVSVMSQDGACEAQTATLQPPERRRAQ